MKDNQKLEKHFRFHGIEPIKRFNYRDFEVFISEGGPYFDKEMLGEFPTGWYESAYAIGKDEKAIGYRPLMFDFLHNMDLTNASRKQARINSAIEAAKKHIDITLDDNERV